MKKIYSLFIALLVATSFSAKGATVKAEKGTSQSDTLRCNQVFDYTDNDSTYIVKGYITTVSSYNNGTATLHMDDDYWISVRTGFTAVNVHSESGDVKPKLGDLVWVKAKLHQYSNTEVRTVSGGTYGIIDRGGDVIFIDYYFEEQGVEQTGGEVSDERDGVTVYASKAYGHMNELRVYKNSVFEISSEDRYISHIRFTFSPSGIQYNHYGGLKTIEKVNAKKWRIDSMPSQARISKIEVFFGSGSEERALDNVDISPKAIKTIRDGQLLIERNGKLYNVSGAEVK